MMNVKNIYSTGKAASALGVTPRRVLALIQSGRLPAIKIGRDWVIKKIDLKLVSIRKPGRPVKV